MDEYPIILAPVSASPPFEQHEDQKGPERFAKILQEQSPQYVINLLGLPSVAVPTVLNNNIPIGVQIILVILVMLIIQIIQIIRLILIQIILIIRVRLILE